MPCQKLWYSATLHCSGICAGSALSSCRQTTSGLSRPSHSQNCAWRARMPLTFQVAIFTASVRGNLRVPLQRARAVLLRLAPAQPDARIDDLVHPFSELAVDRRADHAVEAEGHLVERVVHLREAVLRVHLDLGAQPQAGELGLVLHPAQRDLRQAVGRALGITAADVGVRADEPALLDHLGLGGLALGPYRGLVVLAPLVDRDRVVRMVDDLGQARVVPAVVVAAERDALERNAER